MIQIVENHQLIKSRGFKAAVSHSIGGPINNNMVVMLETSKSYFSRGRDPYKPWGLPSLSKLKPKHVNIDTLLSSGSAEGSFVATTARCHYKTGKPEVVIVIVACKFEGSVYRFLFGADGEHYDEISELKVDDRVLIERVDGAILINSIPVRKFYAKTINGLVELANSGWKRIRRS